MVDQTIALVS